VLLYKDSEFNYLAKFHADVDADQWHAGAPKNKLNDAIANNFRKFLSQINLMSRGEAKYLELVIFVI
jgi:hypothetical protein